MSERIIQIFTAPDQLSALENICKNHGVIEQWQGVSSDERLTYHILTDGSGNQALIDVLQAALPFSDGKTRLVVLPVEAHLPVTEQEDEQGKTEAKEQNAVLREELYKKITAGAEPDRNFFMLVCFATIVAAIGLIENNTAVLVGAMVIAPFLGPNLAQTFAAAMGERSLFLSALRTNLLGSALAFSLAFSIGFFYSLDALSEELLARAYVDYSSIFLALASGSAAVLSLTRGISSVLVGVMVAVALLPPLTASALFLGIGMWANAANAALLLAVNIVCINLAGVLTFATRGIGPRSWWDKRKARSSVYWFSAFWGSALLGLLTIIAVRNNFFS